MQVYKQTRRGEFSSLLALFSLAHVLLLALTSLALILFALFFFFLRWAEGIKGSSHVLVSYVYGPSIT
jgi:hypothetical protein